MNRIILLIVVLPVLKLCAGSFDPGDPVAKKQGKIDRVIATNVATAKTYAQLRDDYYAAGNSSAEKLAIRALFNKLAGVEGIVEAQKHQDMAKAGKKEK